MEWNLISELNGMEFNKLSLELSCYYWCWCSMLGDLLIFIQVDSLSISLGTYGVVYHL